MIHLRGKLHSLACNVRNWPLERKNLLSPESYLAKQRDDDTGENV